MNRMRVLMMAVCVTALAATPAMAHHEGASAARSNGLLAGLEHPLFGLDHLLAMIAVGLLSPQLGTKRWWALPVAFVGFMVVGGAMGMTGVRLWSVEFVIAASVLLLGLAVASGKRLPVIASLVGVGLFGLAHGHAHGTELPSMANPFAYVAGFVIMTAAIHISGVMVARFTSQNRTFVLRYSGAAIAATGLFFLLQVS